MALGCRASAIIYQNTRVYGNYQLIIAINRQLTLQPNATPNVDPIGGRGKGEEGGKGEAEGKGEKRGKGVGEVWLKLPVAPKMRSASQF